MEQLRNDQAKTMRNARQNGFDGLDNIEDDGQEGVAGTDEEPMSDPGTAVGM